MALDPRIPLAGGLVPDFGESIRVGLGIADAVRNQPLKRALKQQQLQQGQFNQEKQRTDLEISRIALAGNLAQQARSLPLDQRQAFVQQNSEALARAGIDPNRLGNLDDQSLDRVISLGRSVAPESAPAPIKLGTEERLVSATGQEIVAARPSEEKVQPKIDKLRSRFDNARKDLVKTDAAFRKVNTAPETAAGDMSLIFGFMKLLDPGSTVREGEFATAEAAAGIPTRIVNAYNRALDGTRLSAEQRAEFKSAAENAFEAQQTSADEQTALILQQADQDNVPRAKVLGAKELKAFEKRAAEREIQRVAESSAALAPTPPQFQDGQTATNPQTGERVVFRNGQWQPI